MPASASFISGTTISSGPMYRKFQSIQLFSTITDPDLVTSNLNERAVSNALHTVMVHRNKQSLAFREGTPLVFTKSIAATYSEILDDCGHDNDG